MLLTPTISESVSLLVSIVTCTPKQALVKDFVKVIVVLEFLPQYVFPHFKINVPICIPPFVPLFEKLVIAKPASLEAVGKSIFAALIQIINLCHKLFYLMFLPKSI